MRTVLALLLLISSALAADDQIFFHDNGAMAILSSKPPTTIVLSKVDEHGVMKQVTIDFGGDTVKYSGDLPVDEAAKVFFDATMKQFRNCDAQPRP